MFLKKHIAIKWGQLVRVLQSRGTSSSDTTARKPYCIKNLSEGDDGPGKNGVNGAPPRASWGNRVPNPMGYAGAYGCVLDPGRWGSTGRASPQENAGTFTFTATTTSIRNGT